MPKDIRDLAVDTRLLEACDVSHLVRLFFNELSADNARLLSGTIVLTFPKYDNDNRPNCTIPEIRNFIQKLHDEEPRFPFYYVDERLFHAHLQHIACLSPLDDIKLIESGTKFVLKLQDPSIIENYLGPIDIYMQQLEYSESEVEDRINKIAESLGLKT